MNFLPWNIVRKDFRRTRIYLVAWWAILAAGAIITIWNLNQIMQDPGLFYYSAHNLFILDSNYLQELPYLSNWLVLGLDTMLLVVIVDLVFKADSPIDERTEWRTRPISGLGVWRAKLFYLGLFCYAVPGAIQALEYIYLGNGWADCLHGLARFVVLQSFLVAIVASAAVLFQRTFSGLLFFCGVALAIILLEQINFASVFKLDNLSFSFRDGQPNAWAFLVILGFTGLGVSALMYAGKSRAVGRLALGGGALAAMLTCFIWPKFASGSLPAVPQRDDRIQLAFDDHPVGWMGLNGNPDHVQLGISPKVIFRGAPGDALLVTGTRSRLSWPTSGFNPPPEDIQGEAMALINIPSAVAAAGYGRLLGYDDLNFLGLDYSYFPTHGMLFSKEKLARLVSQPARWQGSLTGEIGRLVVDWDVPLDQDGQWIYNIHETQWTHNQAMYKLVKVRPFPRPDGAVNFSLWETSATNWPWLATPTVEDVSPFLLLYNPDKKEVVFGGVDFGHSFDYRESLSIYFITQYPTNFDLTQIFGTKYPLRPDPDKMRAFNLNLNPENRPAYIEYLHAWQKDRKEFLSQHYQEMADWLKGARLVELHFEPDHAVYNTATIDSVQIITPDMARAAGITLP